MSEIDEKVHKMLGRCCHEAGERLPDLPVNVCRYCGWQLWGGRPGVPCYSESIEDAFEVVEWMRERGYDWTMGCVGAFGSADAKWQAGVYLASETQALHKAQAPALSEAICLAALQTTAAVEMVKNERNR